MPAAKLSAPLTVASSLTVASLSLYDGQYLLVECIFGKAYLRTLWE
jgi:hypothetical protein